MTASQQALATLLEEIVADSNMAAKDKRKRLKQVPYNVIITVNPIALRKAKIVYNFGFSECNRVNILEFQTRGCI